MKNKDSMQHSFYVEGVYSDGSEFGFTVLIDGPDHSVMATLMQITRGLIYTTSIRRATCYNSEGFYVCSYVR